MGGMCCWSRLSVQFLQWAGGWGLLITLACWLARLQYSGCAILPRLSPKETGHLEPLLPLKLCLGIYQSLTCITLTLIPSKKLELPWESFLPGTWRSSAGQRMGFTPSFSSQPDFDPCCGASEEQGWARLGVSVTGLWGVSDSYNSYFCEKVEGEGEDTPRAQWWGEKSPRCESRAPAVVQAGTLPVWFWFDLEQLICKKEMSSCVGYLRSYCKDQRKHYLF